MKRKTLLIFLIVLTFNLLGCTSNNNAEITIGISQYMEHPALDRVREGFIEEINSLDEDIEIDYLNCQGEISNAISIAEKFNKDEVDLVLVIGTPTAQATKEVIKDIPILFSAVTDPVDAGLVEDLNNITTNITGTSDKSDINSQLKLFNELDEDIKTIGALYNTEESNSISQIKELEKIAPSLNLKVKTTGINDINEVEQALDSLMRKVDAFYLPSDNTISSSIGLISKKLTDNNIISICAEEAQVEGGVLITKGIDYRKLGSQTGNMAKKLLIDGEDIKNIPVEFSESYSLSINKDTWNKLGLSKEHKLLKEVTND